MWVFGLFLAIPLIEIALFVTVGGAIGLMATMGFIFASAMLGLHLLRRGAGTALGRATGSILQLSGTGFSMISAAFLILPGFFTSFLGLVILLPIVQRGILAAIGNRLKARGFGVSTATAAQSDIIDADFTVIEQPQEKAASPSKWARH